MRVGARPEGLLEHLGTAAGLVPRPIFESYMAFFQARVIMAGSSLGVFKALSEGPSTAASLAKRLRLDGDGMELLLDALCSCGYLERRGGSYRNAEVAERYLDPSSKNSLDNWVGSFCYDLWDHVGQLEAIVKEGVNNRIHDADADHPYWERYMYGLFDLSKFMGEVIANSVPLRSPKRMIDLAGGHGGYSMAFCRRHKGLKAVVVELEGAARTGERIVAEQGMANRVQFKVGDLFKTDLGSGYDLACAFDILHHFDPAENVKLLSRARSALRPGGTMVVFEQERGQKGGSSAQIGAMMGLLFYLASGTRSYTADEISGWFDEAGFRRVTVRRPRRIPGNMLVLGKA